MEAVSSFCRMPLDSICGLLGPHVEVPLGSQSPLPLVTSGPCRGLVCGLCILACPGVFLCIVGLLRVWALGLQATSVKLSLKKGPKEWSGENWKAAVLSLKYLPGSSLHGRGQLSVPGPPRNFSALAITCEQLDQTSPEPVM